MRDELGEDDVELRGDGGGAVPRGHGGGEFGGAGSEARKLRLVRPTRVGSGGDRTEGSRFEIEFRCQRGIPPRWTLAWNYEMS